MSWERDERYQTQHIVKAGEILQTLKPSVIGTLQFVRNDTFETQAEIATALDCSSSTVTTYLQSLANIPLPLVTKQGTQYSVTDAGNSVIDLLDRMLRGFDVRLNSIDWETSEEQEQLETLLEPLHNSRSAIPFFLIDAIGSHRSGDDAPDLPVGPIVADVKAREEDRGQSTTRKQVRWTLGRFDDADVIDLEDNAGEFSVTEKGCEHVWLLNQFTELVADRTTGSIVEPSGGARSVSDASHGIPDMHPPERQQIDTDQTITPTYCLGFEDDLPDPVMPLPPTTTVDDLLEQLQDIKREQGGDTALELHWALWSELTTKKRTHPNNE